MHHHEITHVLQFLVKPCVVPVSYTHLGRPGAFQQEAERIGARRRHPELQQIVGARAPQADRCDRQPLAHGGMHEAQSRICLLYTSRCV